MPGELSLQLPKARILCLHGYGQNADFFRARTGALRKALKSSCDFTFLDGTFEARASFLGDADGERGAALGWWEWEEADRRASTSTAYVGVDTTILRIRELIQAEGPFDGLLGFSQGATLAALLCLDPEPPPLKFALFFAAFAPKDPRVSALFEREPGQKLLLPTLHVMGKTDALVPMESSKRVSEAFAKGQVLVHEGGHAVPSGAPERAAVKQFIAEQRAIPP